MNNEGMNQIKNAIGITVLVFVSLLLSMIPLTSSAQAVFTIQGTVTDKLSGAAVSGASVYIKETANGSVSDEAGHYELREVSGSYTLVFKYLGYEEINISIELHKDLSMDLTPGPAVVNTPEVVIESEVNKTLDQEVGAVELSKSDIAIVPEILGESDLIKVIQLLPGVSSSEGQTGYYVRGGGPDQNLVLLDGASIYNASHLLGFFSVFNTGSVKDVKLIKGSMPASYGGRLSSVLDISTIDGDDSTTSAEGSIGLIAANATVQGPIKKGKISYFVSGRRTYFDILAQPVLSTIEMDQKWGYYFYDLNGKLTFNISDKDKITFSGYFGRDVFSVKNRNSGFGLKTSWGNDAAILGYTHVFGDRLLLRSTLNYTGYRNQISIIQDEYEAKLTSGIGDLSGSLAFHYFPNTSHHIESGINYTYHNFLPTNIAGQADQLESIDLNNNVHLYSHDLGLYALDEWEITPRVRVEYGIRFSYFQHVGPFDRYLKNETNAITDTIRYLTGEEIEHYSNGEPRLALRIKTKRSSAWKLSFDQNYQYIHLASYATVSLPTDVWIPSTDVVKPQFSTQYSLGNYKIYEETGYELSIVAYYKIMRNQIEYRDGFSPEDEVVDNVDNNFVFGEGKATGAEFLLKKVSGAITGWLGYTISSSMRQFDDINNGKVFAAKYDRLHDLSLVLSYELNKRWQFSTVFVYATGNATTMPIARYTIEGKVINEYGERNSFRMPAYHRMDIAATYVPTPKITRRCTSTWKFSIFNLYNHSNPYFIYFDNSRYSQDGIFETKAKLVTLFPFMPSVSWNFNF